ncbi:MAG: cytochrome-c oxidase [Thermicanus sp.]|nr:cytochrome-c oxidase [Thermicanus sp.]
MGARFFKAAVIYFLIGLCFGVYMSSMQDFRFGSLHAHINLLGWASTALFGAIYSLYPRAGHHILAKWHFWLHNIGAPFFLLFLFFLLITGDVRFEWGIIPCAILIILGAVTLLVNVFMNVSDAKNETASNVRSQAL